VVSLENTSFLAAIDTFPASMAIHGLRRIDRQRHNLVSFKLDAAEELLRL
jgi:hypothetical protein